MHGCYDAWQAYGMSKRADLQLAFELDRRLKDRGLRAFAADPGFSKTDLQQASVRANPGFMQRFWRVMTAIMGQPASMGALPQLRAATEPQAVGGSLYAPHWITFGAPVLRGVGKGINNPAQMQQLWALCEGETHLTLAASAG
jgi:NAD(P)-dependent dehydrogenase (short-subunit alcohol dehydrogenase family)